MTSSLVGSEMCIRDRPKARRRGRPSPTGAPRGPTSGKWTRASATQRGGCLLYTSDAADDM
eukprot:12313499-Prorocentrum_lima.AAC.1